MGKSDESVRYCINQTVRRDMLNIEKMSRSEKLSLMEALWDNLSGDSVTLASPEWHEQALKEAERALAENQAGFVSWDAAKIALQDKAQ